MKIKTTKEIDKAFPLMLEVRFGTVQIIMKDSPEELELLEELVKIIKKYNFGL